MRHINFVLLSALFLLLSCGPKYNYKNPTHASMKLETVGKVDLNKYSGRWYQVAYYPNSFQSAAAKGTTATYSLRPDGKVTVVNEEFSDAEMKNRTGSVRGVAYAVDSNADKLKVSFFRPFYGDYWIIDLDTENYSYSVVGSPDRNYLWILARTQTIDEKKYKTILERIKLKGYNTEFIVKTADDVKK
jgi:apolipoprotein D and lipocalin family protein